MSQSVLRILGNLVGYHFVDRVVPAVEQEIDQPRVVLGPHRGLEVRLVVENNRPSGAQIPPGAGAWCGSCRLPSCWLRARRRPDRQHHHRGSLGCVQVSVVVDLAPRGRFLVSGGTSDKRDLPGGYPGQRALWIRVGSRAGESQCRGGSARCPVDVIMANPCLISYYERNCASASKFVIGI